MYGLDLNEETFVSKLKSSLRLHEGVREKPYTDTVGKITIGVGRNLTDRGLNNDEIDYLLGNDIQLSIREAKTQDWWPSVADNDVRSRAMVELVFNMGLGSLGTFKNALAALRARQFSLAKQCFLDSKWASQVGSRAITLTNMIETGVDS